MARKNPSIRLRFEVFKRDNFMCRYCGQRPPDVELVLDHVLAVAADGPTSPENLVTSCSACNGGKSAEAIGSAILPAVTPEALEGLRASVERQRQYAELRQEQEAFIKSEHARFEDEWLDLFGEERPEVCRVPFPAPAAVKNLMRDGVRLEVLIEAAVSTERRYSNRSAVERLWKDDCPRYFFGCVKGKRADAVPPAPSEPLFLDRPA